jgi:hypothetical protein
VNHAAIVSLIVAMSGPDRVDPEQLADAVEKASGGNRDWAALLLTVIAHEASFSDRIRRNEFRDKEADPARVHGVLVHRAWGLFQEHANLNNRDVWGSLDLSDQVASGSRMLKRSYWNCARAYPKNASSQVWVSFTLTSYSGQRCGAQWAGLAARIATFESIRRRIW